MGDKIYPCLNSVDTLTVFDAVFAILILMKEQN